MKFVTEVKIENDACTCFICTFLQKTIHNRHEYAKE